MLKPLIIGKRQFNSNLIQAPLAGISCAPFRELVWQFGGIAYCCTEMLSAHHIASGVDRSPRYLHRGANEPVLCWQLSGNQPALLAKAATRAIEQGADLIDLNCGCPQPKIRQKDCGSRLLTDEKKLSTLIRAMKQDPAIPVTLKIRIDADQGEFCETTLAEMAEQAGADAIIVHGRHWTHDYDVPAQYAAIKKIVDQVKIPVIANGDIADRDSVNTVFQQTGCAGFMIARASIGKPWLFRALVDDAFEEPSLPEIGALFLKHAAGLVALEGEKIAILQSRRFGKYYGSSLQNKSAFIVELNCIETFDKLIELITLTFV